jgi:hypothetical protein
MVAKDEQLRWVNMRCVAHLPNSGDNPFQIESPIDFFPFVISLPCLNQTMFVLGYISYAVLFIMFMFAFQILNQTVP